MTREQVIKGLECCIKRDPEDNLRCDACPYPAGSACANRLKIDALELLKAQQWRKFEFREPDEDEKASHPKWVKVLIGGPDDGEEILATDGRYVWKDEFCVDDECYLDCSGTDLEECWWMPLPEPPKEELQHV